MHRLIDEPFEWESVKEELAWMNGRNAGANGSGRKRKRPRDSCPCSARG
jgi:hypothetical protein